MTPLVPLLSRFILRYHRQDWLRTVLTLLGVGLGLSVLVAITVANRTALASFEDFTRTVGGRATYTITSHGPPLDETVLERLQWAQGQARFGPVVRGTAVVQGTDEVLELTGLDLLADWQFAPEAESGAGRSPSEDERRDYTGLLVDPGAVLVADTLAARLHLTLNGPLTVVVNGHPHALTVRAVIDTHGMDYDDSIVLMDVAAAQHVMERLGVLDRIDVRVDDGVDRPAFLAHAVASLPAWATVAPPRRSQEQAQRMTQAFQLNLTALSLVSLMVGTFLVYNTVSVSVVRRRPEIGIMRALGTRREEVFMLFLLEGGCIGLVGSILGIAMGWALSFGAVKAVAQTVDLLYVPTHPVAPHLEPWIAVVAVLIGVLMSLGAACFPAAEAASVPPAEAMGRGAQHRLPRPHLARAVGGSLGLIAGAALLCRIPPIDGLPLAGFIACLFILLGGAALAAPGMAVVSHLLRPLTIRVLGAPGMAAMTHLQGALKRIGIAVAALAVGMAMVTSVAIMIRSFRDTVVAWVEQTVKADIFITASDNRTTTSRGTIDPDTVRTIRALPGIRSSDAFFGTRIEYQGDPAWLGTGDFNSIGQYGHLQFMHGRSEDVITSCIDRPRVLVSEPFATRHHVTEGQTLTLDGLQGPVALVVAGIYYDYSTESGWIVMDRSISARVMGPVGTTNLALYLNPGVDADAFRRELRRRLGSRVDLDVESSGHLRAEVLRLFNQTFAVTDSIELIAVGVAVLAVVTTLMALILERRRDVAILRCLGTTREQIMGMVLLEALLIAVVGVIVGLATGLGLAWVLIFVINKQSFGWTLIFHVPPEQLAQVIGWILLATVVAAVYPAGQAARVEPAAGLRDE